MELHTEVIVADEDRRDALRLPAACPEVAVEVELRKNEWFAAEVLDVSRTGLRLRSFQPFPSAGKVMLRPPVSSGLTACSAQVVREAVVEDEGPRWFDYGLRFLDMESEERHAWFLRLRRRDAA
jgi:hypothetical protein